MGRSRNLKISSGGDGDVDVDVRSCDDEMFVGLPSPGNRTGP